MDNGIAKRLIEHAQNGILIYISNGMLKVSDPEGNLTEPERLELKNNKERILKLFTEWEVKSNNSIGRLSYQQQRLWLIDKIEPGSAQYNMPWALRFDGKLDANALQRALTAILDRHQILRTVYKLDDQGDGIQVVREAVELALPIVDLSHLAGEEQAREVSRLTETEASLPFDLSLDPMLRAGLIKLSSESWVLLVTMHHIAADGWSRGILTGELSVLYAAALQGQENPLPPLPIQYMDYAHWQQEWLQNEALEKQLEYWAGQLQNLPAAHNLPLDRARPTAPTYRGGMVAQFLGSELRRSLNTFLQSHGVTLFMVLHATFASLLSRYSGECDIVIGSPIANREQAELAPLVGFFVNTLVLRSDLSGKPSFIDLLAQSKKRLLAAYEHQQIPFEKLVDELKPERSLGHNPLFQVMLVLHNNEQAEMNLPGLTLRSAVSISTISKFDLTLNVTEDRNQDGLYLEWEYAADLFDVSTIERIAGHFERLLKQLILNPQCNVYALEMLSEAEHRQLREWNVTATPFPDKCIHELFEEQVERNPEATAVVYEDQRLSYGELNARANRLAHYLRAQGVGPDTLVGVCLERSVELVVSILGILKAGGAYVPLDPEYPAARLEYMLEDAELSVVLTATQLRSRLPAATHAVCMDEMQAALTEYSSDNSQVPGLSPAHLAYGIYTSGSTGKPKCSLLIHKGLVNLACAQIAVFGVHPAGRVLQFASIAFDAATSEWAMALCAGAGLVLVPAETARSPDLLGDTVVRHGITHATCPPVLLPLLEQSHWRTVTTLVVAGEACPQSVAEQWSVGRNFYNAYGPSEATVCASIGRYHPGQARMHIGRPIDNVQLYVMDGAGRLLPVGVPGELYIGGEGVARGYWKRKELTAEKFIENPYGEGRLYKTGDLARYLPDGNLEFLGRIDHQVKIRGFRVELGEIETALRSHEFVRNAVAVASKDELSTNRLLAYITTGDDNALSEEGIEAALKQYLGNILPKYMVPSVIVLLDAIPLTPNGKVDRKALPAPSSDRSKSRYIEPRTKKEQELARIFSQLTGIPEDSIGINDNFFDLGGDSLMVVRLASKCKQSGMDLSVKQMYIHPTIAELAELENDDPGELENENPVSGEILLLRAQEWFLEQNFANANRWNVIVNFDVHRSLNVEVLRESVKRVMILHDSLRARFSDKEGKWITEIPKFDGDVPFTCLDLSSQTFPDGKDAHFMQMLNAWEDSLSFTEGPLIRVSYVYYGENPISRLSFVVHHLAVDGYSIKIVIEDLLEFYRQLSSGLEVISPAKTASVCKIAEWSRCSEEVKVIGSDLKKWFAALPWNQIPRIPRDLGDSDTRNNWGSSRSLIRPLGKAKTRALQKRAKQTAMSFEDLLLLALANSITSWTGYDYMQVTVIDAGRDLLSRVAGFDVSRSVGWISLARLLFLQRVTGSADERIQAMKEQLASVPYKGLLIGDYDPFANDPERRLISDEVKFNFGGIVESDADNIGRMGNLLTLRSDLWSQIPNEESDRAVLFQCQCNIYQGDLLIRWDYSINLHLPSTVERLVSQYIHELEALLPD